MDREHNEFEETKEAQQAGQTETQTRTAQGEVRERQRPDQEGPYDP